MAGFESTCVARETYKVILRSGSLEAAHSSFRIFRNSNNGRVLFSRKLHLAGFNSRFTGPSVSSSQAFIVGTKNSDGGMCPPSYRINLFGSRSSLLSGSSSFHVRSPVQDHAKLGTEGRFAGIDNKTLTVRSDSIDVSALQHSDACFE